MLVTNTLFGIENKIETAIARIKEFEPIAIQNNPAGYYVCISGGKDSSVIQELCIMANVKCEFAHNHTSVDYPETVYFIRREKERLEKQGHIFRIEIPRYKDGKQKTMWSGIYKKGLPARTVRWCCQELKEHGGRGRYIITGVRWAESAQRKKRAVHETFTKKKDDKIILNNDNDWKRKMNEMCLTKNTLVLNPIIDWEDKDIWDFIKKYNLPYNPLYDQGHKRVGCIGCPLAGKQSEDFEKYPKYKEAYFKAVKRHSEYRKERGLETFGIRESPESYFNWWIKK